MDPIIIIGSGLAGYFTAREFRKIETALPLHIVTREPGYFYSKPLISNALSKGQAPQDLISASAEKMSRDLGITLWSRRQVQAIEVQEHRIRLNGDETLVYAQLVLAVGADPVRLALQGDGADAVTSINNLEDYRDFRQLIVGKTRVAILGGGLIGCEFANDLVRNGYRVEVIEPALYPLGRLVPEQAGRALQYALQSEGVVWHLGTSCSSVERSAHAYRLTLSNGTDLEVDAMLSAAGLRPRCELARAAGLATNRGIVVNRLLQTSAAAIYALGDCMEVEGLVLPYVMPITHATRALARTLAGQPEPLYYPAMPVVVKTPAHPLVVCPPPIGIAGAWEVDGGPEGVRAVYKGTERQVLGFALTGSRITEKAALLKVLPPVLEG
jgi:rubredoxin-NAD+ reductase